MSEVMIREESRGGQRVGEMRVPILKRHQAGAELREMARRGEIREAFNPRTEGDEWVVNYVRLREPRSPMLRHAAVTAAILAPTALLAGMIWHARHIVLAGLIGAAIGVAVMAIGAVVIELAGHRRGHCPGAWHR